MPLSMQVTSMPSIVSITLPVGSNAPQLDPATSRNSSANRRGRAGHAVDARVALVLHRAVRRGYVAPLPMLPVFTMWMRTGVAGPATGTSPFSMAQGPTPARMLPQFWLSLTSAWSTTTCRNR